MLNAEWGMLNVDVALRHVGAFVYKGRDSLREWKGDRVFKRRQEELTIRKRHKPPLVTKRQTPLTPLNLRFPEGNLWLRHFARKSQFHTAASDAHPM